MKKNKLILFDWGNIVEAHTTGYNIYDAWDDLFKDLGFVSIGERVSNLLGKYQLTAVPDMESLEKVFESLKYDFNLNGDFDNFLKKYVYYFSKIDYYKDVRDYEISLKNNAYIGILSNLLVIDEKRLDKQVGLDNYDYVFLSFKLKCRKPNLEIYEKVQGCIPFSKDDVLFIDDRKDNIEMAKEFGWNTLLATGLELDKIKRVCEEFLK